MTFAAFPATACWRHRGARSGFEVAYFQALSQPGAQAAGGGWTIDGTTTAVEDGQTWIVSYRIAVDAAWRTREARVTARTATGVRQTELTSDGAGHWSVDGHPAAHLDGCLDVDLESSALTNTLPVHRLALPADAVAEAPAAYVRALDLRVERLEQSYARLPDEAQLPDEARFLGEAQLPGEARRLGEARRPGEAGPQRYRYAAPVFGFTCTLSYDGSGLVLDYPGIAVRAG